MADSGRKTGKGLLIVGIVVGASFLLCCGLGVVAMIAGGSASSSRSANQDGTQPPSQQISEVANNASQASSPSEPGANGAATSDANDTTNGTLKSETKVGDEFTLGDYTYKVIRWRVVDHLGNNVMQTKPSAGAKFVILEYEITNNTNKTQTALTGDFKLRDAKGREFRTASKVESALLAGDLDNQDFLVSELQPGLKRTMRTGFEVPEDSTTAGTMMLVVPEKGFLGTKEVEVKLD